MKRDLFIRFALVVCVVLLLANLVVLLARPSRVEAQTPGPPTYRCMWLLEWRPNKVNEIFNNQAKEGYRYVGFLTIASVEGQYIVFEKK